MQAAQNLFAGEQGVAYIPMPKGRGFTPRLVSIARFCLRMRILKIFICFLREYEKTSTKDGKADKKADKHLNNIMTFLFPTRLFCIVISRSRPNHFTWRRLWSGFHRCGWCFRCRRFCGFRLCFQRFLRPGQFGQNILCRAAAVRASGRLITELFATFGAFYQCHIKNLPNS